MLAIGLAQSVGGDHDAGWRRQRFDQLERSRREAVGAQASSASWGSPPGAESARGRCLAIILSLRVDARPEAAPPARPPRGVLNAPAGYLEELGMSSAADGDDLDFVQLFVRSVDELRSLGPTT